MFAFMKIAKAKGWDYNKISTYGFEEGYHVALTNKVMYRQIFISFNCEDDCILNRLADNLSSNRRYLKIGQRCSYQNGILIIPNEFWRVMNYARFELILNYVISVIKELNIEKVSKCPICGKDNTDSNYMVEPGVFLPFHKSCFDNQPKE